MGVFPTLYYAPTSIEIKCTLEPPFSKILDPPLILPTNHVLQSMLQNSSTATLGVSRVFVQIEEPQKLVQLSSSSDLGLEQSGKSTPSPLVVEKASSVAWMFVLVSKKKLFWLSRQNGSLVPSPLPSFTSLAVQ